MEVTPRSRLRLRLQSLAFLGLFALVISLLAWLSTRYGFEMDWTASGRNSLSAASRELLMRLEGPVHVTAYARDDEILRRRINELLQPYRRVYPQLQYDFVNPDAVPEQTRQLGISVNGELVITYAGRTEHARTHSEQAFTNALHRVARSGERWVAFVVGHGERRLDGKANHDLGIFGQHLERRGFKLQPLDLNEAGAIPVNTTLLVVAGPRVDYLPGEARLVANYLDGGGNLLWLGEPGPARGLHAVAEKLGVRFQPGVLVDPATRLMGIDRPDFVLVTRYGQHPITDGFNLLTLYPRAAGVAARPVDAWESAAVLRTNDRVWAETGPIEGTIDFDPASDLRGPLDVGIALHRSIGPETDFEAPQADVRRRRTQRAVITGDGDFLSNTYLGNSGNLDLGLNLVSWLSADDAFIAIPARTAPDLTLELTAPARFIIAVGFLFGIPLLLLGVGLTIWLRRRRR